MSPMSPLFVLLLLPSLPLVTCTDVVTVQSLMTLVEQQAATIQTLQARVTSLENGAQQSLATQHTVQTLQTKLGSLENSVRQSLTTFQQQHTVQIDEVKGQIAAINSRLNTQVYFNAHMSQYPVDIGTNNAPMKFDAVTSNVGNGYNPQTGVFTAPVSGTYVMYAQLMQETNLAGPEYIIAKAGIKILCANSLDGAVYDKSLCLASVHLQKGETVYVRRDHGGQHLHGYWFCAFSGFLLSADAS